MLFFAQFPGEYAVALAYLALLGRILLLGYEKIALKQLSNEKADEATVLYFTIATLFLVPSLFFCTFPSNYTFLPYVVVCSLVYTIAFIWFVKALSIGEASLVSPLYDSNLFFVAILSAIFLGESLTVFKLLGFLLLIAGSSFLDKQQKNLCHALMAIYQDRACRYMIGCSILVAIGRIVDGIMIKQNNLDPLFYTFSLYFGITFWLLVNAGFKHQWQSSMVLFQEHKKTSLIVGFINAYAYCFLAYAFTQIEVSIAQSLSMLAMIVTMILAKIILQEEIGRRWIGAVIMLVGAWLVLFKL